MFGCTASIPTAHRSWMTNTPRVIRPGRVSSSNLSFRILTTTSVLERLMQAARYRSALLPGALRTPRTQKNASPSAIQMGTCSAPVSKTAAPPDAIFLISISSPITKSRRMRPISATVEMLPWSVTNLRPIGPMITPVARYAMISGCLKRQVTAAMRAAAPVQMPMLERSPRSVGRSLRAGGDAMRLAPTVGHGGGVGRIGEDQESRVVEGIDHAVGKLVGFGPRLLEVVGRVQQAAHASLARVLADPRSAGGGRVEGDVDATSGGERSDAIGEGGDRRVAAVVRDVVRARLAQGADRHRVDDVAGAALGHVWHHGHRRAHGAQDIGFQHPLPVACLDSVERSFQEDAGHVDEDVDLAHRRDRVVHERADR